MIYNGARFFSVVHANLQNVKEKFSAPKCGSLGVKRFLASLMPVLFQEATQSFPVLENLFSFHNMPFFPGELKFICFHVYYLVQ